MENENLDIESNILENNYFKLSFPNQNYKLSLEYKNWRKSMEERKGKNGVEIFCKEDNIIIYLNEENNQYYDDLIKCPLCNTDFILETCVYCSTVSFEFWGRCCLPQYINEIIQRKKIFQYINNKENMKEFFEIFFINFIPVIFSFQIIIIFVYLFFFNLKNKRHILIIEDFLDEDKNKYMHTFQMILFFYSLCMSITFSIFFYCIYIIIVILSLPFKLYPIKIIIGIIYAII